MTLSKQLQGSAQAETWTHSEDDACLDLLAGDDELDDSGKRTVILAGEGDDAIHVVASAYVAGGPGDDFLEALAGGAELDGGPGADTIHTYGGHHIITPGEGADTVIGGAGNIVVQILDACELQAGESLVGNGPDDTLVIPVSPSSAAALGVTISGFEHVRVTGPTCASACAAFGCEPGLAGQEG
ncbi:hypothetical protein [Nannocystis pusilla]|uniref:hypothetical protein n=1 Tax=Nannocystis pusilla TaxID=889268 RepID=UPI003DA22D7B